MCTLSSLRMHTQILDIIVYIIEFRVLCARTQVLPITRYSFQDDMHICSPVMPHTRPSNTMAMLCFAAALQTNWIARK